MTLQQQAEQFVSDTLAAAQQMPFSRTLIAGVLLDAAGVLMRQDVMENPQHAPVYAEALELVTRHALAAVWRPEQVAGN